MKRSLLTLVAVGLSLLLASYALAADFTASTSLTTAGTIGATLSQIDSKGTANPLDDTWAPAASLSFGTLSMKSGGTGAPGDPKWVVFLPQYYYAIDVGFTDGVMPAAASIGVSYAEGDNPNAPNHGLGWKASITPCKTYFALAGDWAIGKTTDLPLSAKVLLKDGATVSTTDVAGGWLRVYIGVNSMDPAAAPWPGTAEIFSPGDVVGSYGGTITVDLV